MFDLVQGRDTHTRSIYGSTSHLSFTSPGGSPGLLPAHAFLFPSFLTLTRWHKELLLPSRFIFLDAVFGFGFGEGNSGRYFLF